MTIYLDSSALAKLLRSEPDEEIARAAFDGADTRTTSAISYPELCATLAAWHPRQSSAAARDALAELERSWPDLFVVRVDESTARQAGELALRHRLRGMDAIHLASALGLAGDARKSLSFVSWDRAQRDAARKEGLTIVPGEV